MKRSPFLNKRKGLLWHESYILLENGVKINKMSERREDK